MEILKYIPTMHAFVMSVLDLSLVVFGIACFYHVFVAHKEFQGQKWADEVFARFMLGALCFVFAIVLSLYITYGIR